MPPDDVTIRPAVRGDAAELARLRYDFTVEHELPMDLNEDRITFERRMTTKVGSFLRSGRWRIWAAQLMPGELVGNVWVERVDKVPRPYGRPEAWGYVTNMYVAPAQRNTGVGQRLLEAAMRAAERDNWELLLLWPSETSREFYSRAGFRPAGAVELVLWPDLADVGEGQPRQSPKR